MKAKIFVGGRESGKSRTANMIAEYVGKEKTAIFFGEGLNNHPFVFSEIKEDTQLIIIDGCPENFDYSRFFPVEDNRPNGGELKFTITREIRGQKTQIIHVPYLIFITNKLSREWLEFGASFDDRFDIIQFPLSNPSTLLTQKDGTTNKNTDPGEVITKKHAYFTRLMYCIDNELSMSGGCNHKHVNFHRACTKIELLLGCTIDREKTLQYLECKGGHCDCEILMNAQYCEDDIQEFNDNNTACKIDDHTCVYHECSNPALLSNMEQYGAPHCDRKGKSLLKTAIESYKGNK